MAFGADPYLTLAHLTSFLPDPAGPISDVHAPGFIRILGKLLRRWYEDGAPAALGQENLLAQLHRIPIDRLRVYARAIWDEEQF